MLKLHRWGWWFAVPALLLLFLLLLRVVAVIDMHPDETLVYHFTRFDLQYAVNYQATSDVHPPLWFAFFWVWRQLVGVTEFAGRMQALLFSLLALALAYRLGRDWFGSALAGVFSLVLLGINAYFIAYALEIRPYALVMLLGSLSMWFFSRWLRRESWRLALVWGALTGILFYVHYFSIFLVLAQVVYFLTRRPSRHQFGQAVGAGLVAVVVWLPQLPTFLHQVQLLRALAQQAGNSYGLGIGTPATTQATSLETVLRLAQLATNGQPLLYALVLAAGIVVLRRSAHYRLALLWALGVPALSLFFNLFVAVYTQRYVAYLTVGLALAAGAALASLRFVRLRGVGFVLLAAVSLWSLPAWLPAHTPYRVLYSQVAAAARPEDRVLNLPASRYDQFLQWQQQQYLPAELAANATTDPAQLQGARRIWFMTGDWFDPAVRQQFEALEPSHPVQQVFGQCNNDWCYLAQLLEAPPLPTPVVFGDALAFWGADVDTVTDASISTRLWWRMDETPALDYSFSLRLLDASGAIFAQNDGAIHHYGAEIVQTSQLQPGKIYIDWRTLSLPSSLPAGTYRLELVVYQSWDGTRLPLPDDSDALLLQELRIP